jgi:hypothetical protein
MTEDGLKAIEAHARMRAAARTCQDCGIDPEDVIALVAEVRRLRDVIEHANAAEDTDFEKLYEKTKAWEANPNRGLLDRALGYDVPLARIVEVRGLQEVQRLREAYEKHPTDEAKRALQAAEERALQEKLQGPFLRGASKG